MGRSPTKLEIVISLLPSKWYERSVTFFTIVFKSINKLIKINILLLLLINFTSGFESNSERSSSEGRSIENILITRKISYTNQIK